MSDAVDPTAQLRRAVLAKGGTFCERCQCCEMRRQTCETCDGVGFTSRMANPILRLATGIWHEPIQCETCGGTGGWWVCTCDDKGEHNESWKDNR